MDVEPQYLPYQFVEVSESENEIRPFQLDSSGTEGIYEIQNNWREKDTLSSVVFSYYPSIASNRIEQLHARTTLFRSDWAWDYDQDGTEEVAVSYLYDDRLWIEIFDAFEGSIYRRSLVHGVDGNGNGHWDGTGIIAGVLDLTADGHPEIFVSIFSGYDRTPRGLYCLDWFDDTLLWKFDLAGNISEHRVEFVRRSAEGNTLIVFGVSAPANGVTAGDMDDRHTWLICLDTDGLERWKLKTGRKFGTTRPVVVNTGDRGSSAIYVPFLAEDTSTTGTMQVIAVDLDGHMTGAFTLPSIISDLVALDYNGDGTNEVCAFLADNTLHIFEPDLSELARYNFNQPMEFVMQRDLLGLGKPQILLKAANQELWLFSQNLEPLARLAEGAGVAVLETGTDPAILLVTHPNNTSAYVLRNNPWYQVLYFKYKNQILVILGALAAGLAMAVYFQRRTRANLKLIQAQKTQLERVHAELRAAQQQIIAQEKFNQARDIAGGVAHEIHNALCPAINVLEKLRTRLELTEEADVERNLGLLQIGEDAIARGMRMTELVKAYTRLESEKRETVTGVPDVISEVLHQNALRLQEMSVSVELQVDDNCTLFCNRDHAYSMINNLVLNALDALSEVADRRLVIRANSTVGGVAIEVEDSGPGIPEDIRDKIFDVFFSTKPGTGSGLGLTMVKKIVDMYAGTVEVKSEDKEGTRFIILFPESALT